MGKANALKAKAAETAAAAGAGNLQVSQPRSLRSSSLRLARSTFFSAGLSSRFNIITDRVVGPLVVKSYLGTFQK